MKRNESFILKELNGVPYLLPYGQAQLEFRRSCRLNKTGAFLWNLLEQEHSMEELAESCADAFHVTAEELPALRNDVRQFLEHLAERGCLSEGSTEDSGNSYPVRYLRIGSLVIRLEGVDEAFSEQFHPFYCDARDTVDQTIVVHPFSPFRHINGMLLLRSGGLTVIDAGGEYALLFPLKTHVEEAHLSKDASRTYFYCHPPYTDAFREELFHAIRFSFLYLAQKHHMAALHSASFLYQGKAWLFSGPSGTGKSTHTNLWKEMLQVPLLNGDVNLLALKDGQPVIHGLPWCGTSGICDPGTYPLGGIILLKQSEGDWVETLSPDDQRLLVLQRLISPSWTSQMLDCNLNLVEALAPQIYIARLHCTKEFSAVTAMKAGIDSYLTSNSKEKLSDCSKQ